MGATKRTKKFAAVKRMITDKDPRFQKPTTAQLKKKKDTEEVNGIKVKRNTEKTSALFYSYNQQLGPPFRILLDTNFTQKEP